MGRKPTRYEKELGKGEPRIKEILFSGLKVPPSRSLSSDNPDGTVPGEEWAEDREAYRTWSVKFTPEFQKPSSTTDEDLNLHHKEVQALLDQDGEGYKIPFFSDWATPPDNVPGIAVFVDEPWRSESEPGHLQIVCLLHYDDMRLRGITWKTLKPPRVATNLKKAIRDYHKGGDDKQMTKIFNQLLGIFKELDEHKNP